MDHPSAHKGSYVRKTPRGQRAPGRRRSREQVDKDARALDLYCQGKTHQQIADIIGWKSASTSVMAVQRAISDRRVSELDQVDNFAIAVARLQRLIAKAEADLEKTYYVYSNTGKLVNGPDGRPLEDDAPKQRVRVEIRHLQEHLDKLQGNFAPTKVRQEIVPEDVVDREIAQLAAEIAEAGKNTDVPSE